MNYVVKGSSSDFELYNDDILLGQLTYSGILSIAVTITISDGEFKLGPADMWNMAYHIVKDEDVYVAMRLNWGGSQIIEMAEHTYEFRFLNLWNSTYTLYNENEQPIVVLETDYDWKTFRTNYIIETNDSFADANNPLLLMALVYCCNHRRRRVAMQRV